jgi:predicted RNase H-like nuclease (RuvC/YqgF family)
MEALGISMKSVLTEAQEVQANLKESSKECQMMIQEYKRKITALEKQTQNFQKQYSALNDLISLFIQTTK